MDKFKTFSYVTGAAVKTISGGSMDGDLVRTGEGNRRTGQRTGFVAVSKI